MEIDPLEVLDPTGLMQPGVGFLGILRADYRRGLNGFGIEIGPLGLDRSGPSWIGSLGGVRTCRRLQQDLKITRNAPAIEKPLARDLIPPRVCVVLAGADGTPFTVRINPIVENSVVFLHPCRFYANIRTMVTSQTLE